MTRGAPVTEVQWIFSENANDMYRCLREQHSVTRRKAGKRKSRLFGCACARWFWDKMTDPRSRAAVEYAERFADGEADLAGLAAVRDGAQKASSDIYIQALQSGTFQERRADVEAAQAAFSVVADDRPDSGVYLHWAMRTSVGDEGATHYREWRDQQLKLSLLLREIFGNPFRPITFAPAWRTDTAVSLARQMYSARDFSAMPILADALQDAGCANEDVLEHCRDAGRVHVRGCWVVDLVLGKA